MTQMRCVMIDKLRKPNAPEVRHVGPEIQRHRMKRSLLSMTPMQIFCQLPRQPATNLDALPALFQKVTMLHSVAER